MNFIIACCCGSVVVIGVIFVARYIETAMTNLTGRQTAYQAAMAATSRVMNLSLANYL